ncbi:MAG: guanylate kinase [Desulfovibrio sp.]|nr:guanylate kinase [Desulfovibrio sp.]
MNRSGVLVVVSAPSGAGKTTLCSMLRRDFPNIYRSVSCATRAPREGEKNGVDYLFVTRDDFSKMIEANRFLEYAEVHGNMYGTPRDQAEDHLAAGRDVLLEVDVKGAANIKKLFPAAKFAFILPPSAEELERRLRKRGLDDEASVKRRLRNAAGEIAQARWYDAVIINDDLRRAYDDLKNFYLASTLAPSLHTSFIDKLARDTD